MDKHEILIAVLSCLGAALAMLLVSGVQINLPDESVVSRAFRLAGQPLEHEIDDVLEEVAEAACDHSTAVEVRGVLEDDLLAWWCPGCETQFEPDALDPWKIQRSRTPRSGGVQLDENWEIVEPETVEIHQWGHAKPIRTITAGTITAGAITANEIRTGAFWADETPRCDAHPDQPPACYLCL